MQNTNPYSTPKAPLEMQPSSANFEGFKPFSSEGRLGRLRYLVYTFGITMVGGISASLLALIPTIGIFFATILYIGILAASFFLTIQRSHDFNASGWLSVLYLIPLVSLVFFFIPGSTESNQFGEPTPPNSTAINVISSILITFFVLAIIGMIAAITIPALQSIPM